jgi:hypothetical protein
VLWAEGADDELDVLLDEIVKEQDSFKLANRGHAAIEDAIDKSIAEAFKGTAPRELTALPFRTRFALFGALTQMPKKYADGYGSGSIAQ